MNLGVSTYSFWHFKGDKLPLREYLRMASRFGFSGVEILENHLESLSADYLKGLRRQAFDLGLCIYSVSIHNNFVKPSETERENELNKVKTMMNAAYILGATIARVNTGRWQTSKNFDELMDKKGVESPIQGYTDDDAFNWVKESVEKLVPTAEDLGVIIGMENHWGVSKNAKDMVRLLSAIKSNCFKAILDTGNFIEDTYQQMETVASYAAMVQAKTYFGGGVWYQLDLNYDTIFDILKRNGFNGWVSLEYEGKADYEEGVSKSKQLLSKYIHH
jgi:L-ribulose-5-phosphate 3-epimerase